MGRWRSSTHYPLLRGKKVRVCYRSFEGEVQVRMLCVLGVLGEVYARGELDS